MKNADRAQCGRSSRRAAFTMIELLVVVAVIAILVGMIMGIAGFASRKSATGRALAELEAIKNALEEYRLANGTYFSNTVTTTGAAYNDFVKAMTGLVSEITFTDPWGRVYQYVPSTANQYGQIFTYRLWSQGPSTTTTGDDIDSASGVY